MITAALVEKALAIQFDALPADIIEWSRQCILDWMGVTLAGAREPLVEILVEQAKSEGGHEQASLVGRSERVTATQAALINGAASHALDYDDVNWALEGHPSVAVIPGLLALAESRGASEEEFIAAFVAGYETACRVGTLVSPDHYRRGFHATATAGSFGAAAACARLLELDANQTAMAFGIAGTQAAGLKSMFGTMCKPLHAGRASQNGLLAASLAARGFDSRPDVLECPQGFAATQSSDFNAGAALADPPGGFHMRANLFKYHAACYLTHSSIECALRLRARAPLDDIEEVIVEVADDCDRVCNIANPKTGLEAKFSLRLTTALALSGCDTGALETYSEANCANPVCEKVRVVLIPGKPLMESRVTVRLRDGRSFSETHDAGIPSSDLENQRARLMKKFHSLNRRIEHVPDILRTFQPGC
jgi:2-methylcitrate dehydratase PrpD